MLRGGVAHIRNEVGQDMPCVEATEDLWLDIGTKDRDGAIPHDPRNCAIARCIARTTGQCAFVFRYFTYTWDDERITRYTNGRRVQDYELLFDVGRSKNARLKIMAPSPGRTTEAQKQLRKTSVEKKRKEREAILEAAKAGKAMEVSDLLPTPKTRPYVHSDKPLVRKRVVA